MDGRASQAALAQRAPDGDPHDAWILDHLLRLTQTLGATLPPTVEVVLHDVTRLPNSIIGIAGYVTGRRLGDPATDLLLQLLASGEDQSVGYSTRLSNGREMRSSTVIFRNAGRRPVAALCINTDITAWMEVRQVIDAILAPVDRRDEPAGAAARLPDIAERTAGAKRQRTAEKEIFPRDVDELASYLISQAVTEIGVPPEMMRKDHKLHVVKELKKRGLFLVRDAVTTVAKALGVTRFTIYNYLNEIDGVADAPAQSASHKVAKPRAQASRRKKATR